ncbi:hypothetical protein BDA99DRAFT_573483 [Phascolomyces articulosus]|uniref:GATA-type domain-containing protein n=1 Tax=Phascolomyces articulosus TaxID=60185 RepID=A0AAD5JWA4_9FUNG|nr:hypothetical protein BDA99DRAFT_573483 [Phascolomyces articulosus]
MLEDEGPSQLQQRQVSRTQCSNCGTTKTPLWRRTPFNGEIVCNACGLFLKARNAPRPVIMTTQSPAMSQQQLNDMSPPQKQQQTVKTNLSTEGGTCPGDGHCNGTGGSPSCAGCPSYNNQHQDKPLQCTNCSTRNSPLWRRDTENNIICNACGLYYKLHNFHRPTSMKRTVIKRRKRSAPPPSDPIAIGNDNSVQQSNNENDLENRMAELDALIDRLQRLRQGILDHRNKSTITTRLGDMTDSLNDIINKAEITLLT